jgi:hypothetical protein
MLLPLSVILVHFQSRGYVRFHGAEDGWLSSTIEYHVPVEYAHEHGLPTVPAVTVIFVKFS